MKLCQFTRYIKRKLRNLRLSMYFVLKFYFYLFSLVKHVVVCGEVSDGVFDFFEELFHVDHGVESHYAVVVTKGAPSDEMLSLLRDSKFSQQLMYIDGNVMDINDLERGTRLATISEHL